MIDSAATKQVYLGDGSTTNFPIPFPYLSGDDVKCAIYDIAEETETQLTSDYYVDTVANKVVYPGYPPGEAPPQSEQPGPLPVGKKLVVYRSTPITQLEDLGDKYPLPIIEDMTDKNTLIEQEQNEKLNRAVLVDMGGGITPKDVASDIKHLKEYRNEAQTAAGNAATSATNAANSASAALAYKNAAALSASSALASETNALSYKNAAAGSASNAATSESNALSYKNAAAISATSAITSASNAAASETHAAQSEDTATTAADTALINKDAVIAVMPTIINASVAAQTAAASAKTSETLAGVYASSAATQAEIATNRAEEAGVYCTSAYAYMTSAAISAGSALTYAAEASEANDEAKYYAKITMDKIAESAVGYPHQDGSLTYDGTEQTPTWDIFYEPEKMTVTGTTSATNAGTYTIYMTPKSTYYWWDTDGTETRSQTWTIGRQPIANVPSQSGALVYNGTAQSPTWNNYDSTKMDMGGTTSATEAGTYTATFTPKANYKWADGTTTAKNVTWSISSVTVACPTISNTSKTYDGTAQSPTISSYDPLLITASGDLSATDAGTYSITFSLNSASLTWADTTTADKSATWTISPKSVTCPSVSNTSLTYDGTAKGPTISAYSSAEITQTGDATATNAGSYTVTFSLTSAVNYIWSDSTTAAKEFAWTIGAKSVTIPTMTNKSKTYNGSSQAPTISAFSSAEVTQGGTASATNAGTYTVTWDLTNTSNYKWSDNSTSQKSDTWTIAKAAGSMSLSKSTVSLNTSQLTDTITVTRSGDGAISAVSSDTSIATVSVSGTTVTVTGVATGSATITISVAEGTNYLAPTSETVSVAVSFYPVPGNALNTYSWSEISQVARDGRGDEFWDVGDYKEITLDGKIGDYLTLSNQTLCVFILDFNHKMNGSNENNIIFGGFRRSVIDNTMIYLNDSKYSSDIIDGTKCFNMNHTGTTPYYQCRNYGGWKGSDLRYDILGATSTAPSQYNQYKTTSNVGYDATASTLTSPKADTLLAALPSDLRSVIRLWTRWIDAVGDWSDVDANIKATVDAVTLLAEIEVFSSTNYANQYEANHNTRMTYYALGNAIQSNRYEGGPSAGWLFASPYRQGSDSFVTMRTGNLTAGYTYSCRAFGLAPAFKV